MSTLKKGSWVRARGGIQNDTFVRDLIMMAQINYGSYHQLSDKIKRQKTASELNYMRIRQ